MNIEKKKKLHYDFYCTLYTSVSVNVSVLHAVIKTPYVFAGCMHSSVLLMCVFARLVTSITSAFLCHSLFLSLPPSLLWLSSCICDIKQQWIGITQPRTHTHTHTRLIPFELHLPQPYPLAPLSRWKWSVLFSLARVSTPLNTNTVCVCVCVSGIRAQLARWGEKLSFIGVYLKRKGFLVA